MSESELQRKRLIASLGQCKASITRLENNLKAEAKFTAEDLNEHKKYLSETFAKYQDFSSRLQHLTEEFDDDEGLIELRYLDLLHLIELKIQRYNTMIHTEEQHAPTVPTVPGTKEGESERQETRRNTVTVDLRKNEREETLRKRCDVPISDFTDEEEIESTPAAIELNRLVLNVAGGDGPEVQLAAVRRCCKMAAAAELVAAGVLPALVGCLARAGSPELQKEAARALTNYCWDSSPWIDKVVHAGAVPCFLQLLESPHENACEQAVWVLGNIIDGRPELRDLVVQLGMVQPLLSLIKPEIHISILRKVARVIVNLCRSKDPPLPAKTIQEILSGLNTLIMNTDSDVLVDTIWAIRILTAGGNEQRQMVVESGIVPRLVPLVSHEHWEVQLPVLQALGNLAAGTEQQTRRLLDCDVLSRLPALLSRQGSAVAAEGDLATHWRRAAGRLDAYSPKLHRDKRAFEKEFICGQALHFLSIITAGNERQVQAVIDAGLLPKIIENLSKEEIPTQRQAARAVANLSIGGSTAQVAALIACGAAPPFCSLLSCEDTEVINTVLGGLDCMLRKAGQGGGAADVAAWSRGAAAARAARNQQEGRPHC